ncbi:hypothetical protein [Paraburkholderia tagetis]|uniref:Uncharacterized protein n=1 Tax=Paraburkholderia tagetis TaxID=2913261 RepID=A0A9X1UGJ2_9BURK|nr:hypothetical protein [Paraburkholderia tagetis]MCG5072622.1 hypothetical protein [Paraburkholderia tagetis]
MPQATATLSAQLAGAFEPHPEVMRLPLAQLAGALPPGPTLRLYAVTDQPGLYVLHAPSLAAQGAMFSRVVALIERRDMPRDHVVTMNAVAANARRFGEDPAGLTAGNNFSAAQIAQFFELAQRQHVSLTEGERALQTLLAQWGLIRQEAGEGGMTWRAASPRDFLITIPGTGKGPAGEAIDTEVRAAILSHELGHWRFFSDPDYAHACRTYWWHQLTFTEREALTEELTSMGYDPSDRIVIDELQAYLLHTPARYMPLADLPGAGGVDIARVKRGLELSVRSVRQNAGQ